MTFTYISLQFISEYQTTETSEYLKKSCTSDLQDTTYCFCYATISHALKSISEGFFPPQKCNDNTDCKK